MSGSTVPTYAPGPWIAASQSGAWLLVDLDLDDERVTASWMALDGDRPEQVLEVLLAHGLAELPGFALVVARDAGTRIVVRHPATVTCHRAGSPPEVLTCAAAGTWTDVELTEECDEITIHADGVPAGPLRLPLARGITPAGLLTLGRRPVATGAEPAPTAAAPSFASRASHGLEGGHVDEDAAVVEIALPEPPEGFPAPAAEGDDAGSDTPSSYYGRLLGATVDREALLAELAVEQDDEHTAVATDAQTGMSADLAASGRTAIWPPDASPDVDGTDGIDGAGIAAVTAAGLPAEDADGTTTGHAAAAPTPGSSADLIDGVPWAPPGSGRSPGAAGPEPVSVTPVPRLGAPTPTAPAAPIRGHISPSPPTAAASNAVEAEVLTVNRAELLRAMAAPPTTGPTVLAVRCPQTHLTPAYSPHCRVCGEDIADQVPAEEPRPALGRLVLSTGETVILDRDVILGRSPESAEQDPALRPHLVCLTDSGEVSRMHVRITLDGWQPLLRDLGSSNGTTLTLTSSSAQQLRPQEDYVLEPGCEVSLADVVSFRFDVVQ